MSEDFGKVRDFFWPIHRFELKKLIPMVLMMFFFIFNYTIMRYTKDTLLFSTAGAEAIPFLKFWGTMPMSILFVLIYAKLSNILSESTLFYVVIAPFFLFFALFGYVFYPFREYLQLNGLAESLGFYISTHFPEHMQDTFLILTGVIRNWIYVLFYIFAELWGSVGVSLLFWQFANNITGPKEARRFYPRFTQLGTLSLVFAGLTIIYFSDIRGTLPKEVDAWGVSLRWLTGALLFGMAVIVGSYWWINRYVLTDKRFFNPDEEVQTKKEKPKMSLLESFKLLISSPYLGCIALLVLCYGVSINLTEVVWKKMLSIQFPNENDLNTFYGKFAIFVGFFTFAMVTVSASVVRKIGWLTAALITPIFIAVTAGIFFVCILHREALSSWLLFSPLMVAVMVGFLQNGMAKGTKYALFDPTKEMAYIPLDQESKVKGKAAIDVIGARLGKSGGGVILQAVLMFGTILQNLPLLFFFIASIVVIWIVAAIFLNQQGKKAVVQVAA